MQVFRKSMLPGPNLCALKQPFSGNHNIVPLFVATLFDLLRVWYKTDPFSFKILGSLQQEKNFLAQLFNFPPNVWRVFTTA